jgi:hypothetical protein
MKYGAGVARKATTSFAACLTATAFGGVRSGHRRKLLAAIGRVEERSRGQARPRRPQVAYRVGPHCRSGPQWRSQSRQPLTPEWTRAKDSLNCSDDGRGDAGQKKTRARTERDWSLQNVALEQRSFRQHDSLLTNQRLRSVGRPTSAGPAAAARSMAMPACRAACAEVMTPVNLENPVGGHCFSEVLGGAKGHRLKGSGRQNHSQAKADCE